MPTNEDEMKRRETTLPDGRYLVYYTFAVGEAAPPAKAEPALDAPEDELV